MTRCHPRYRGWRILSMREPSEEGSAEMKTALQGSSKEDGSEGKAMEFTIVEGEDGRTKAIDVTGLDGSSIQGGGQRDGFGGGGSRSYGGGYGFNGGPGKSGGVRGGGYGGGACYNYGETGHLARDCYKGNGWWSSDGGSVGQKKEREEKGGREERRTRR